VIVVASDIRSELSSDEFFVCDPQSRVEHFEKPYDLTPGGMCRWDLGNDPRLASVVGRDPPLSSLRFVSFTGHGGIVAGA